MSLHMGIRETGRRAPAHLNVSEIFGPTIQGEGRHAGALASFFRLGGCNLSCSWCDSAYTWDWSRFNHSEQVMAVPIAEVVRTLRETKGRLIVTGGEPLLQAPALAEVLQQVGPRSFDLETNGTRPLGATAPFWSSITCSPKIIPSADQGPLAHGLAYDVVDDPRTDLKFVIRDEADLYAVDLLVLNDPHVYRAAREGRVWLMPEGITPEALTERTPMVIQAAADRGFNFTSRLHVYGWHDVRGH